MSISGAVLESIVEESVVQLRKDLGKQWLSNPAFGTRLHGMVGRHIAKITSPEGWLISVDKPIRTIPQVEHALLDLTVREFIEGPGMGLAMYRKEIPAVVSLDSKIGNLKPDLFIRQPDGSQLVWDLTSQESKHVIKTMLYAHVLTGIGQRARIAETYWLRKYGL